MFGGNGGVSLADIGALLGNRNGGGFGDNGGIWALIILFALFGRNGWGNNNGQNGGGSNGGGNGVTYIPFPMNMGGGTYAPYFTDSSLQRGFDNQSVMNKLNGLENGQCNLGYQQLAQVNNLGERVSLGFAGVNSAICQQQYDTARMVSGLENVVQNAANQANVVALTNQNALQAQISGCCCDMKGLMAQAEYNRATDTCSITRAIQDAANSIIQNDNANYRQLHDEQVALQMQGYKDRIAEQNQTINFLNLAQSQANQNNYLVQTLRPTAVPAYVVPNPYAAQSAFGGPQGCCNQVVGMMN